MRRGKGMNGGEREGWNGRGRKREREININVQHCILLIGNNWHARKSVCKVCVDIYSKICTYYTNVHVITAFL